MPRWHFAAPGHWINDPNGLIVHEGVIHLFYQVNPSGIDWGNISWGHATGKDYVSWQDHGVAIPDTEIEASFSGCIVYDESNSSGLGTADRGPLVALYTGARHDNYIDQHQNLAYSNDGGDTWTKYAGNPVLPSPRFDIRDPKVFWHEEQRRWIMTLVHADLHEVGFYGSYNLIEWQYLSAYGDDGCDDGEWECSDLIEFDTGDGGKRHVLFVSVAEGLPSGGSGVQYFVGEFDGSSFKSCGDDRNPLWADMGPDFYAAQSWYNASVGQQRVVMSAWMSNRDYAPNTPTSTWRGCHVFPRELRLQRTQQGYRVHQSPVAELERYRGTETCVESLEVSGMIDLGNYGMAGDCFDLELATRAEHGSIRLQVLARDEFATGIVVNLDERQVTLDRRYSGHSFHDAFDRQASGSFERSSGGTTLRLIVDRSTLEVFVNEGDLVFSALVFPPDDATSIGVESTAGTILIDSISFWPLQGSTDLADG